MTRLVLVCYFLLWRWAVWCPQSLWFVRWKQAMQIKRIQAYRVDLPLVEGDYKWSGGKSVSVFDSTVVQVETDAGVVGWGEVCPLGPFYLPAYAAGARAALNNALSLHDIIFIDSPQPRCLVRLPPSKRRRAAATTA